MQCAPFAVVVTLVQCSQSPANTIRFGPDVRVNSADAYSHTSKPKPVGSKSISSLGSATFLTGVDISEDDRKAEPRKRKPRKKKEAVQSEDTSWLDELQAMHSSINLCFGDIDLDADHLSSEDRGFFKEARQWEHEVARLAEENELAGTEDSEDYDGL